MHANDHVNLAIGVDLGGTKMRVAVVDATGKVWEQVTLPTDVQGGPDSVISDLLSSVRLLQGHLGSRPLQAVGIAIAGQVEAATGNVLFAPNLYWRNVPIASRLKEELHLPVVVANDVRAATWGEMCFGAGRGVQDLICLFVGTGIGGGVVSKGALLAGHNNSAGEVGHMVINCGGAVCTCGNRGCWETLAGGWGISKMTKEAINDNPQKGARILFHAEGDLEKVAATHLFQAAREGDPLATSLARLVEEALVAGVTSLVNAFNPQCIILGGGIIDRVPWLIEVVDKGVRLQALKSATEKLQVLAAKCASDAPVLGIAALAME